METVLPRKKLQLADGAADGRLHPIHV